MNWITKFVKVNRLWKIRIRKHFHQYFETLYPCLSIIYHSCYHFTERGLFFIYLFCQDKRLFGKNISCMFNCVQLSFTFYIVSDGGVAQSVERSTPGEELGFDFRCGRTLPTGWVGVSIINVTGWDRSHGLPALSHVWQHVKLSEALSWGRSAI